MSKVLIAESVDEKTLSEFQGKGIEFVYLPNISPLELEEKIKGFDGLIVRPKPVSEKAINNSDKLKLVIRGGAGVNSIALDACRNKGIIVENTPGLNSDATAEFTILLMMKLFCKRQIYKADGIIRETDPGAPEDFMGHELRRKKLGIIGLGNIGQRVAKIATAFGMEVTCYARNPKEVIYNQTSNLDEAIKDKDIISLHIPLSKETNSIIGEKEFSNMKRGAIVINTARPQLIDAKALLKAADSGQISAFGIDGDYDLVKPFLHKRGILTHHIADMTFEAQENITRQALTQALEFFTSMKEINRVV